MYYFKNFTDNFSKTRAAVLIGLSCGFLFSAEHFISANCTAGLTTYENAVQNRELSKQPYKKLFNKWKFIKDILENRKE
jgi:ribosome-associated toxin RatA of RatAB toxin-antitoxin module